MAARRARLKDVRDAAGRQAWRANARCGGAHRCAHRAQHNRTCRAACRRCLAQLRRLRRAIAESDPVQPARGAQQSHSEYDPSRDASAAAPAVPTDIDIAEARRLIKALIKELIDNVAMGSAMPADGKHRQHLSRWLVWWRTGAARKSLQLDCAGLSLAVYCLARLLSEAAPALARVRPCGVLRTRSCLYALASQHNAHTWCRQGLLPCICRGAELHPFLSCCRNGLRQCYHADRRGPLLAVA